MAIKFGAKRLYFSSIDDFYVSKGWPDYVSFHKCLKEMVPINSGDPMNHGEELNLVDGTILLDVDEIVFCTGFLGIYPFMHQDINLKLTQRGQINTDLYKGVLWPGKNLAYVGMHVGSGLLLLMEDLQTRLIRDHIVGKFKPPAVRD